MRELKLACRSSSNSLRYRTLTLPPSFLCFVSLLWHSQLPVVALLLSHFFCFSPFFLGLHFYFHYQFREKTIFCFLIAVALVWFTVNVRSTLSLTWSKYTYVVSASVSGSFITRNHISQLYWSSNTVAVLSPCRMYPQLSTDDQSHELRIAAVPKHDNLWQSLTIFDTVRGEAGDCYLVYSLKVGAGWHGIHQLHSTFEASLCPSWLPTPHKNNKSETTNAHAKHTS